MSFPVFAVAAPLLALAGAAEYRMHCARRDSIRLRIHVNGTRGKSTVTRLVAAGLREHGVQVMAKTTGTAARIIGPGGKEIALRRRGPVRITELMGFVRMAARAQAKAIVAECMAVDPENQRVAEHMMLQSHIGVMTRVALDHCDVMGSTEAEVAAALASTIPRNAHFVALPGPHKDFFAAVCKARGTVLHLAAPDKVSDEDLSAFTYPMFRENLALALEVCAIAGVPRAIALSGMQRAAPDPGLRPTRRFLWRGRHFVVVNAFAANDAASTNDMWQRFVEPELALSSAESDKSGSRLVNRRVILLHHRADRAFRIPELGALALELQPDSIIMAGQLGSLALRQLAHLAATQAAHAQKGRDMRAAAKLSSLKTQDPDQVLDVIADDSPAGDTILVFCAGNTKGLGLAFADRVDSLVEGAGTAFCTTESP